MDALLAFAVAETQAAAALGDGSSETAQPQMLMAQVGCYRLSPVCLGSEKAAVLRNIFSPLLFAVADAIPSQPRLLLAQEHWVMSSLY